MGVFYSTTTEFFNHDKDLTDINVSNKRKKRINRILSDYPELLDIKQISCDTSHYAVLTSNNKIYIFKHHILSLDCVYEAEEPLIFDINENVKQIDFRDEILSVLTESGSLLSVNTMETQVLQEILCDKSIDYLNSYSKIIFMFHNDNNHDKFSVFISINMFSSIKHLFGYTTTEQLVKYVSSAEIKGLYIIEIKVYY